jgi:hypothetical protein
VLEYAERVGAVVDDVPFTVGVRVHKTLPGPGHQLARDLVASDLLACQELGQPPHRLDDQVAALDGAELDDLGQQGQERPGAAASGLGRT